MTGYCGREYDLGDSPFPITLSGYNLGYEGGTIVQDRRGLLEKVLFDSDCHKKAGLFYVERHVWVNHHPIKLSENEHLRERDIYYMCGFPSVHFSFSKLNEGHKKIADLAKKDDRVSYLIALTWLNSVCLRWGWHFAQKNITVCGDFQRKASEVLGYHLHTLTKTKAKEELYKKFEQRIEASRNSSGNLKINLVYMSKEELLNRYT